MAPLIRVRNFPEKITDVSAPMTNSINIVTCICVDTPGEDREAHYPQLAYVKSDDRRSVFWKCAIVFFQTSLQVNPTARHFLYTNDSHPPILQRIDCRALLEGLGVIIVFLPFVRFKPPAGFSQIFRNNYYKLDVLYAASRSLNGALLLFDSDVVWIGSLPAELGLTDANLLLYPIFSTRSEDTRAPNGISSVDLAAVFQSLDPGFRCRAPQWFGGELIGGSTSALIEFSSILEETFLSWCAAYDQEVHRFPDGSSIFDGDEFLLAFVANRKALTLVTATGFLRRIWTEVSGGGSAGDLSLSAWHLPNEKLRGIPILFDDFVRDHNDVSRERISGTCGVPARLFYYQPPGFSARASRMVIAAAKWVMPLRLYNWIRGVFGRAPISSKL
jgi:hypothetical protein